MKFEAALKKLEDAVAQLEAGDLPLDKALEIFETGIKMSRICSQQLEIAEQKVELLLNVSENGQAETSVFDTTVVDE
jgi:exodeoxyribonuclease VII small subunit